MSDPEWKPFSGITLQPERRQYPRYSVHVQLELRQEGSDVPIRMQTTDLSRNGCYVETNMTLTVGVRVEAKLWLEGNRIVARGRVVTSHPQYGNGIMFLEFDEDGAQRLQAFLKRIRPE
jgi:c-di-GMP-binding flagellar brake protein YcgR